MTMKSALLNIGRGTDGIVVPQPRTVAATSRFVPVVLNATMPKAIGTSATSIALGAALEGLGKDGNMALVVLRQIPNGAYAR